MGVYSTPDYSFSLVFEFMERGNLFEYLRAEPNASKLQLVPPSILTEISPAHCQILDLFMSDCRDRARPTSHARSGHHPWESENGESSAPHSRLSILGHHTFTRFPQTNVLVDSDCTPRIAGLGSETAPEILNGAEAFSKEADVFSFAMVMVEVGHTYPPPLRRRRTPSLPRHRFSPENLHFP